MTTDSSTPTAQSFLIDALDYYMGPPRYRAWIQSKDLRKIRLAIHAHESRTWWQAVGQGMITVLGIFLP